MNGIQSLIDRQLGIYCRLNYDSILKRLVVDSSESFYGLQSAGVVATYDQDPPIFACRFAEVAGREHILALANEDGRVAIQDTTSTTTSQSLDGFQCHNNAVFDLAWMPGTMNFVTVSGDHTACLWDVGAGGARRVLVCAQHARSVKTAAARPGGVFATGARDGHILVWDARAAQPAAVLKPDNCLASCHSSFTPKTPGSHGKRPRVEQRAISITGLVFQDDVTLLSCGECDGNIKAWDLRKNYSAYKREPLPKRCIAYCGSSAKNGYTNLVVDDARVRLYASCMDDVIYCFNIATYSAAPERRYVGHENATFYIKTGLSPDCEYLVSGSSDKSAYVWNVRASEPVLRLAGHRAEVTCAAWCRRGDAKLVTCGDDARHKIWRIGRELAERAAPAEGRAEPVPRRARVTAAASSPPAKRARAAPAGERKTKRCLAELMDAAGDAAEAESMVKRLRLEPAPAEERLLAAGCKRPLQASPPRRADWSYISPKAGSSFMTPTRNYEVRGCRLLSPRASRDPDRSPETPPKVRIISFRTPTKDLPNFVMSGEAPHLRLMSPVKKKQDRPDWLTQLGREKKGKRVDAPDTSVAEKPGGEKLVDKLEAPSRPAEHLPARRSSQSERAPRPRRPTSLLNYFNVTTRK